MFWSESGMDYYNPPNFLYIYIRFAAKCFLKLPCAAASAAMMSCWNF